VLAPDRVHLLTLAIPPEASSGLSTGSHAVRAVVRPPDVDGESTRVVSEPVTVVVRAPAGDPAERAALERRRDLARADFALRSGRLEEAASIAAQLAERDPADPAAHALLGDAASALRRDGEARDAYRAALRLVAGQGGFDEAPQLLLEQLRQVEARLAPSEAEAATAEARAGE
jgi:hypothetical protein